MKKTIEQKRLEFLEETIAYYSVNPEERRCVNKRNICAYNPESVGKTFEQSEGCAIGRHLSKKLSQKLDIDGNFYWGVSDTNIEKELPRKLKDLGITFLQEIQDLHDSEYNWSKEGLSENGKLHVRKIKEKHCNETIN